MYSYFNKLVLRIPSFPFSFINNVKQKDDLLHLIANNSLIQEAIYIASPVLYCELQKLMNGELTEEKEKDRILYSLMRYVGRMSTRTTPFGLFAGCTSGQIGNETKTILGQNIHKQTRLDMYYLCALSQHLSQLPHIRQSMNYYPNTSLYAIGKKYRYVESLYSEKGGKNQISSANRSVYLDTILKKAKNGSTIQKLCSAIQSDEIREEEANEFINELIDSQILISELSPKVTGEDYLNCIINLLDTHYYNDIPIQNLKEIRTLLQRLDTGKEDVFPIYRDIIDKIETLKIPYKENLLFQVDMTRETVVSTLGKEVMNELKSTLAFLNRITPSGRNEPLEKFRQLFYDRYEEKEIPLMQALDPEMGIAYPSNANVGEVTPLLDNFNLPQQFDTQISDTITAFQIVLLRKAMDAIAKNEKEIVITDNDIKDFPLAYWEDLPPTIYTRLKLIKANLNDLLIQSSFFGGSSGANLLARFCHLDKKIEQFAKEITTKEHDLTPEIIYAEIVHLPESRVGNILLRPHLRGYELLYLSYSDLPINQCISVSDLMLSVKQEELVLRSKRLNKRIIPRLTTAHNYQRNPTPVYRFLCDMQIQKGREALFFNWGNLERYFPFRPRVRYKNTILSLATWILNINELQSFFSIKDDSEFMKKITQWRERITLPRYVVLADGDNELFVDWTNLLSIRSLFAIIKKRTMVQFMEFIFDPHYAPVKDQDENAYLNEYIVAFHKDK